MSLVLYNTLTRKKEEFKPLKKGFVGIYVCGPTVYGHSHLGHAKSYISFDVVVRWFRQLGYKVRYVQNITDVGHLTDDADAGEDKINKQAKLEKIEPMEVVETYTRSYFEDMDKLNNLRPSISPRASGHIVEQITAVEELLDKGYAYESGGNIYFDVRKFKDYGKLSGKKLDELESGVRVAVAEGKRHPADFALWKKAEPEHIMKWRSPWGEGYPGWHLECSTMSTKYLGTTFDIHGGGLENVFPHHECEIAQAEAANRKPFARYWMHNNMVTVDGVKMGKSLGNFITLKEAFKKYDPMTIRLFVLQSHYRSPLDFSEAALKAAGSGWQRVNNTWHALKKESQNASAGKETLDLSGYTEAFNAAMNNDFNTPKALAVVFDLIKEYNRLKNENKKLDGESRNNLLRFFEVYLGGVLGLKAEAVSDNSYEKLAGVIELLLRLRQDFRAQGNYARADEIRDQLLRLGIRIKDGSRGSEWEFID